MKESTESSEKDATSHHSGVHFTPHHSLIEFKSLFKKYFVLVFLIALLPVSIVASYQAVNLRSSAKTPSAAKTPAPTRLPTNTPTPAIELIVDNTDLQAVIITGDWQVSKNGDGYYGRNYLDNLGERKGPTHVKYVPNFPISGYYDIFMQWSADKNRENRVPVDINYDLGKMKIYVNQKRNGGKWNKLGRFLFSVGNGGNVVIRTVGTNDRVIADAIRFRLIKEITPTPTAIATGPSGEIQMMAADDRPSPTPICRDARGVPSSDRICAVKAHRDYEKCDASYLKCENGRWEYGGTSVECLKLSENAGCTPVDVCRESTRCGADGTCVITERCYKTPEYGQQGYAQYACWYEPQNCPLSIPTQPAGTNPTLTQPAGTNPTTGCLQCSGGKCVDGWEYGSDNCVPHSSCHARALEACQNRGGCTSGCY